MKKINKKMSIGEILEICPEAGGIMAKYGMGCIGCPMAQMENLEDGAKAHGISNEIVIEIVKEINQKLPTRNR